MARFDPVLQAHKDWISFVQPIGLVVSPRALIEAQAQIDVRAAMEPQLALQSLCDEDGRFQDFVRFTTEILGWREEDLRHGEGLTDLIVALPEFGDTLTPTYAVRDTGDSDRWLLLVLETAAGDALDEEGANALRGWKASHQARFERLLRERDVPIGVLTNRDVIRLVYAPRGESAGHVTFVVRHMTEVQGRPILAALLMLLGEERLFSLPSNQRLPAILKQSRKYQNEVSERLAGQVLESLWALLYGFQAANDFSRGELLREVLDESPNDVYGGLLATIMRLVFTLYAEDRALLPVDDEIYAKNYSLLGLFETLREDHARYPDTMPQRFGAWSQLLTLFRLLHDGAGHGSFRLPPRHGRLFDPDTYPFLEGRAQRVIPSRRSPGGAQRGEESRASGGIIRDRETVPTETLLPRGAGEKVPKADEGAVQSAGIIVTPRISDGTVYKILSNLLYLDGDRLSYAALDVEEIGSVYEAMMGFRLEITAGRAIGVKPKTKKGVRADVIIDLGALMATKKENRAKLLKEEAGAEVSGRSLDALKSAATAEELVQALGNKVSPYTPRILAKGTMALQPSEERRRSGSHYTPRSLTQPIVKTTLQPVLDQLCGNPECQAFTTGRDTSSSPFSPPRGEKVAEGRMRGDDHRALIPGCTSDGKHHHPRPEQILDMKVCDPAMGSGAFLVESCRFLGEALVRAWQLYGGVPAIPPDEDVVLYARRRVAQACLYGVDRNPFAVDLAKLSLWLATLAKDHPFTFLDHALRHGDSLVGLSREQIVHFDWSGAEQMVLELSDRLRAALAEAEEKRARIRALADSDDVDEKQRLLAEAEEATRLVRTAGDLLIAAFFGGEKERERKAKRAAALDALRETLRTGSPVDDTEARLLRSGDKPLPPFHWFLEFPEVFSRPNSGFDAFVGNPPFAGKNTLIHANRDGYPDWLKTLHEETHGNADLIAQFFRRAFTLTREGGTFGLIATNTIAQGDTRGTGLRWICKHGGTIYEARKRVKWPGSAAVVVSVVHVRKGESPQALILGDRHVERITAFLFHAGGHDDPLPLRANAGKSFQGSIVLGMGFTFDDDNEAATPIAEMHRLIAKDPKNAERIFPYIGGEEVNDSPTHAHRRHVINFGEMSEEEARSGWPDLMEIVERKVKPQRDQDNRVSYRKNWWQYAEKRAELYEAIRGLDRVLVHPFLSKHLSFAFVPSDTIVAGPTNVFASGTYALFAQLQCRPHEGWVRFFGSSLEDRLRYTPTDCFETFPRAENPSLLETVGRTYYEFRSSVMIRIQRGMTETYNRFHDPDERHPDILKLRELHDAMDRAVLDAYGWTNIQPRCEFLLDYEEEEGNETSSRRGKPWRYRWPDEIRDEVLARLLALNAERAKQEQLVGGAAEARATRPVRAKKKTPTPLFELPHRRPATVQTPAHVADGAWARPEASGTGDEAILLATVVRELGPAPRRKVRLAAMLASEPSLLVPFLDSEEASEWKRMVGPEASTSASTTDLVKAWASAEAWLEGTGKLVDDGLGNWSGGASLESISSGEWHTGRVRKVIEVLARRHLDTVVSKLPAAEREVIDGAAA